MPFFKHEHDATELIKPPNLIGIRHLMIILMWLCIVMAYATRISFSIGIVAMTSKNNYGFQVFDWSGDVRGALLSSFLFGYITLQIFAGVLALRFGVKNLLLFSLISNSLLCFLVPPAATEVNWIAVCVLRVLMGFTQGLIYPCINGLLGEWSPSFERGRFSSFVYSGSSLGTVFEMLIGGLIAAGPMGWPSIYYTVGLGDFLWVIIWFIFGANNPRLCKRISEPEREYILATTKKTTHATNLVIPWKKIWTSMPFFAILVANATQSYGFFLLLTQMPTYMHECLGLQVKKNGLYSSLPYLVMTFSSLMFAWLADWSINSGTLTVTFSRKLFNTISTWGPSLMFIGLAYTPVNRIEIAVVLLCLTVGLNSAHFVGYMCTHIDMAPNFATTLMGFTNGFGNILGAFGPLSVSLLVNDMSKLSEWRKVFYLTAAINFFGNLFFIVFGSSDLQSWNDSRAKPAK